MRDFHPDFLKGHHHSRFSPKGCKIYESENQLQSGTDNGTKLYGQTFFVVNCTDIALFIRKV